MGKFRFNSSSTYQTLKRKPWRHCHHDNRGARDVWLNGIKLDNLKVFYADERRGYVLCRLESRPGTFLLNRRRDAIRSYKLKGRVEVRFR